LLDASQSISDCGAFVFLITDGPQTKGGTEMTDEIQEWLQKQWNEFKATHDRSPILDEWISWIRWNAIESDCPLATTPRTARNKMVLQAHHDNMIEDVMDDEIAWKARDARANLNNRSFIDGTF
jgi:hypothetical protein